MTSKPDYKYSSPIPLNSLMDNVADENFCSESSSITNENSNRINHRHKLDFSRCPSSRSGGRSYDEISQISSIMKYSDPILQLPEETPSPNCTFFTTSEAFEDSNDHTSSLGLDIIGKRELERNVSSYHKNEQLQIPAVVTPTMQVPGNEEKAEKEAVHEYQWISLSPQTELSLDNPTQSEEDNSSIEYHPTDTASDSFALSKPQSTFSHPSPRIPLLEKEYYNGQKTENKKVTPAKDDSSLSSSLPNQISSGLGSLQQRLSWRMDPEQSLSDWKLEVFNRTTKTFSTYHVHRVVLAVGPRACGHFRKAFAHSLREKQTGHRVTRLPLISQACNLVPDFLDYLYGNPSFQIQTETAVGLAYLSLFLQQSKLLEKSMEFVRHDLKVETMHHYLVDALYYDQHELVDWIIQMGSKEFSSLDTDSPATSSFLTNLSPAHLSQLLENLPLEQRSSPNLSLLIVEYLVYHKHEVTVDLLGDWASQITMLTTQAALALLELELTLSQAEDSNQSTKLSPLQQRCLEVLSVDWQSLCKIEPSSLNHLVEYTMMSAVAADENSELRKNLIEWLPNMLFEAHKELINCQEALASSRFREAALEDDLERTVSKLHEGFKETNSLRKTYECTKAELKDQLAGWMRKRSKDLVEFQTARQHWDQERVVWKLERKRWLDERSELERELHHLRTQLARTKLLDSYDASVASSTQQDTCPHVETASLFSYISAGVQASNSWSSDKDASL